MKVITALVGALILIHAIPAHAEVRRHDKPAAAYQPSAAPSYLIDMPHEGSGILVAPNWVATVAHTIFYDYVGKTIEIGGQPYQMEKLVFHPGWRTDMPDLSDGDAAPLMTFLANRDDIVLIKLATDVTDREPISVYSGTNEVGQTVTIYGRGAKGNGLTGEDLPTKQDRMLGYFQNVIEDADERWLRFDFDAPGENSDALELEGMFGSGDSGGPSVIVKDGKPYALGLSSWQVYEGLLADFKGGLYGRTAVQVRLSAYKDWIDATIQEE
ncbi:trypsin-like serine protease [Kordiimonas gwangyangensis]|uniref:trypsin-like serine protease n=1 Tax=Kordiimonas gwangyangensis TaxID=288022 RepID=UPI000375BD10|nr:trypsin-like serine protease [Kordiimonas gwangyangensis]